MERVWLLLLPQADTDKLRCDCYCKYIYDYDVSLEANRECVSVFVYRQIIPNTTVPTSNRRLHQIDMLLLRSFVIVIYGVRVCAFGIYTLRALSCLL